MSFSYNTLPLEYFKTTAFEMDCEFDPSNTDAIRNHYRIQGRGFLNLSTFTGYNSTGAALAAAKAQLTSPRKALLYKIGTSTIVSVPAGGDAKTGPIVTARVVDVNTGMFYVEIDVECWTVDCDSACPGTRNPVVSLRWTQTESFDDAWYSNLRTKGLLIVRADLRQSADNFRPLATPGLLPDYRRLSASYTLSPDGLQLEFEFNDKEEQCLPPAPAVKASGTYTVRLEKPGAKRIGTALVELEGPKGTDRTQLFARAVSMCMSRLRKDQPLNDNNAIWWGDFVEDFFAPRVKVSISALLQSISPGAGSALGQLMPSLTDPRFNDPQNWGLKQNQAGLSPPERKRLAGLLTAAFRDPCACLVFETSLTSSGSPSRPPPNAAITNLTTSSVPPASITSGIITGAAGSIGQGLVDFAPYDVYHIEDETRYETGKVILPATGLGPDGGKAKIVSASGQVMILIRTWVAQRTGKAPQLPAAQSPDPNVVFLGGVIVASECTPDPSGTNLVYLYSGYYRYGIVNPDTYQIVTPVPPNYGELVVAGAQIGAGFWTNNGTWTAELVAGGAQPLIPNGVSLGAQPRQPNGISQAATLQAGAQVSQAAALAAQTVGGIFYANQNVQQ